MAFAFFDMDGTIIDGDSNDITYYELFVRKLVDKAFIEKLENYEDMFYRGVLDINEFVSFATTPFQKYNQNELDELLGSIVNTKIAPLFKKGAIERIKYHKEKGDTVIIVTATNDYIVKHIAKALGIDDYIASKMEVVDGHLTGNKLLEVPFKSGKETRIKKYLQGKDFSLKDSCAYGDSVNDIEMMLMCENAYMVDPNENMLKDPRVKNMKVVSFK